MAKLIEDVVFQRLMADADEEYDRLCANGTYRARPHNGCASRQIAALARAVAKEIARGK